MKKVYFIAIALFFLSNLFAQNKKTELYLVPEYAQTLTDRTKANNRYAMGIGLQLNINTKTKFSPVINFTDDLMLEDDKVYRMNADGSEMKSIGSVLKLFVGTNFNCANRFYLSFLTGPAFINGETLLGINPGIGYYLSNKKRTAANISYTNIFNRNSGVKENYSALNFSIGIRLH